MKETLKIGVAIALAWTLCAVGAAFAEAPAEALVCTGEPDSPAAGPASEGEAAPLPWLLKPAERQWKSGCGPYCDGDDCSSVCACGGYSWGYCIPHENPEIPGVCVCFL